MRTVELADTTTVGRDSNNDIVLDEATVSRCHALLLPHPVGAILVDLGSTNGTFVNGVQVLPDEPIYLVGGDVIAMGAVVARYIDMR